MDGWETRGRPADSGPFNPIGVLWHHTAATSSASNPRPSLKVVTDGRSDLAGPLCHALIDYNGVFYVVAAGRANHAGSARESGPIPAGDGNSMLVGWEIDYQGVDQDMTRAQYNAAVTGTAAVLRKLGKSAAYARGHRETSTTGKIDPGGIDLDDMRKDVADELKGGGVSLSGVSATVYDGVLRVFARGTDKALWHYSWSPSAGEWSSNEIGGELTSGPSTAIHGNVLRVFARGADKALWQAYSSGTPWKWQDLEGGITSAPAGTAYGSTQLRVFARGNDGSLWQNTWDGSTWTWRDLTFPISSGPAAVVYDGAPRAPIRCAARLSVS